MTKKYMRNTPIFLFIAACSFGMLYIVWISRTRSEQPKQAWMAPKEYDATNSYLVRTQEAVPAATGIPATTDALKAANPSVRIQHIPQMEQKYTTQYPYANMFPYRSAQVIATYKDTPKTLYIRLGDRDTALRALTELDAHLSAVETSTHALQKMGVIFVFENIKSGSEPLIHE